MGLTLASWLAALQALLPPGRAFTHAADAVLTRLLTAIAAVFLAAQVRLEGLLAEMDPRRAVAMLPDWERLLGLPDDCTPTSGLNNQERQRLAYQRLTEQGGQSRAYFLGLADQLGEPNSTIEEFRQATCNSNCNGTIYSQADEYTWRLNFRRVVANPRVANCNDNCNSSLRAATASLAQCPIAERKPAHTNVLFAYAGTSYKPADLQAFHTRASVAWAFDANGVLQQSAANVLRVVPSPAAVTSALREPASTNGVSNNSMVGAIVGTLGGIGALPNGWSRGALAGVNTDVVAVGTENGVPYIDIRFYGASAGGGTAYTYLNSGAGLAAAVGDVITATAFLVLAAGTLAGVTAVRVNIEERGAGSAYLAGNYTPAALAAGLMGPAVRYQHQRTLNQAGVTQTNFLLTLDVAAGVPVDVTIRFGAPQLEKLPFATSPILTTGVQLTRARDEIVVPSNLASGQAHSGFIDFVLGGNDQALVQRLVGFNNVDSSGVRLEAGLNRVFSLSNGFSSIGTANTYSSTALARGKAAWSSDVSGRAASLNGDVAAADNVAQLATPSLLLGQRNLGSDVTAPCLYIHEFRVYRWRLSAAELQAATS